MPHSISAVILQGNFDLEVAKSYDLLGIKLNFDLTMFPITHYYTACWRKIIDVPGVLPGKQPFNLLIFPCELVVAHLMMKITNRSEPLYAVIETDYFGGIGEQWALVYKGTYLGDENITQISPALKFLGVDCQNGLDEFDTLGLSKYRSMPEYLDKYIDMSEQLGV
jgi:hypothetical protein